MVVCRSEICATIAGDLLDRGHRGGGVALDRLHPAGDVLGRLGRLLRQLLDLVGHDREALAGLAGPRRLDRGVQGQQVGLLGDARDHLDDVADLGRGLAQLGDRRGRGLRGGDGAGGDLAGLRGVRGDLPDRGAHLLGARGHRLHAAARPPPPRSTPRRTAREVSSADAEICAEDADSSSDDAATASAEATTVASTSRRLVAPRRGRRPSGPARPGCGGRWPRSGRRRPGPRSTSAPAGRAGRRRSRRRSPGRGRAPRRRRCTAERAARAATRGALRVGGDGLARPPPRSRLSSVDGWSIASSSDAGRAGLARPRRTARRR